MKIVPTNSAQTLIYVIAPAEIPTATAFSLFPATTSLRSRAGLAVWRNHAATWVLSDTNHVSRELFTSADACVFLIDGNVGMSPVVIDLFREAQDLSMPIQITVQNSIDGRADFDEVIAIVQRVLDEDAVGRYLPIESDEGEGIAGLFDLLTTDLHVLNENAIEIRPSDPEHVNLTIDKRADLIEVLAHYGLSDQQFESLASGNPISIPALESAYSNNDIVKVTPVDQSVARGILTEWQDQLPARWVPTVVLNDDVLDITDCTFPIGVGITNEIVRYWNSDRSVWLEKFTPKGSLSDAIDCTSIGGIMWIPGVRAGDTIRPAETSAVVHPPEF